MRSGLIFHASILHCNINNRLKKPTHWNILNYDRRWEPSKNVNHLFKPQFVLLEVQRTILPKCRPCSSPRLHKDDRSWTQATFLSTNNQTTSNQVVKMYPKNYDYLGAAVQNCSVKYGKTLGKNTGKNIVK